MNDDILLLWITHHDVHCVVAPYFERYQLRLMRDHQVMKTEICVDRAEALLVADAWRQHFETVSRPEC